MGLDPHTTPRGLLLSAYSQRYLETLFVACQQPVRFPVHVLADQDVVDHIDRARITGWLGRILNATLPNPDPR